MKTNKGINIVVEIHYAFGNISWEDKSDNAGRGLVFSLLIGKRVGIPLGNKKIYI